MKYNISLILILFTTISLAQNQKGLSVYYKTTSLYDLEAVDDETKSSSTKMKYLLQMKENFESIEYILKIVEGKSLFETIKKMDVSNNTNLLQSVQEDQMFYVDSKQYIEVLKAFGEKILISEDSNLRQWNLTKEKKEILGKLCYKATFDEKKGDKIISIEAWFALDLPYQFGPKGYHGLPGLILEVKYNNVLVYTANKISWNDELYIEKPSKGKKMSRKEFDSKVSGAVENLKSGNKN
ncbi:MAG: GLPGLI family protein [Flavobacteriaceae bacterium]|nr:GLPGLI family protein [Flavobacteriaceae bacterium]